MDSFAIDPGIVDPLPELAVAWRPPDEVGIEQRAAANHRRTLLRGANSALVFSTVTYPLRHICPNPDIRDALEQRAVALQQIRIEAMFVMNFHCCRLFEHHRRSHPNYPVVPARSRTMETALQLDQATFYRCCTAVFGDEQMRAPKPSANAALEESINVYKASRSRVMSYIPPTLFNSSFAIKELANDMLVAAQQHVRTNFEARLVNFISLQLAYPRGAAEAMVARLKSSPEDLTDVEKQWLEWLELPPTDANIASHEVLFLGKLYDMLKVMEEMHDQDEIPKWCRLFTLLPQLTSCVPSFFPVTTEVLYQVAKQILATTGKDVFGLYKSTNSRGHRTYATPTEFQEVRERMWTTVFNLGDCVSHTADQRIGVPRRNFEYQISTNGYSAAVLTSIPAPVERPAPSPKYIPHTLIGIDPGLRMMLTAYSRPMLGFVCNPPEEPCSMPGWCSTCPGHVGGRRHGKKRSRNRRRRHRRKRRKRRSRAKCDVEGWCEICQRHHPKHRPRKHGARRRSHFLHDNAHVLQVTSREYRHMSRVEHQACWFENLKKRYPLYGAFLKDMPSFKTSSSASLLSRYEHIWKNVSAMLEFCALKGFRKWRFTVSRFKRKAVAKLVKRVVPTVDRDVCVALGKWSSQTHLAGHMHVPLKRFALELSRRATLVMVDEFRTSYLCSECSGPMVDTPFKIYGTTKTKRSRNVRVCGNVACRVNYWERDINASKNMWQLGLLQVTNRPRTPQFCRGYRID